MADTAPVQTHSPRGRKAEAWLTAMLLVLLGLDGTLIFFVPLSPTQSNVAVSLIGVLGTLATLACNWWFGSSQSSAEKNQTIAKQSEQLASSTPTP